MKELQTNGKNDQGMGLFVWDFTKAGSESQRRGFDIEMS